MYKGNSLIQTPQSKTSPNYVSIVKMKNFSMKIVLAISKLNRQQFKYTLHSLRNPTLWKLKYQSSLKDF